ncbi:MAG: ATP-binding cassette domain-containing protein [Bacillota bacterium]
MLKLNIEKSIGDFTLNKEWQVDKGEIITLFGPSGSGKSITIKAIAGLITPDNGWIELDGTFLFHKKLGINLPPQERHVGYVPQHYALFPHLTVLANIAYGLKTMDKRTWKEVVDSLLESVNLQDKRKAYPHQLSGGEKQRAALIRAMAVKPKVLLLDEPFSAVDALLREKIREEVKEFLSKLNIPVVLVTHDPQDVEALGTTVANY